MFSRRIREANEERRFIHVLNTRTHHVELRMTDGLHLESLVIVLEGATNLSVPQVECLINVVYIRWGSFLSEIEAHHTQMQAVRVGTIPVGSLLPSYRIVRFYLTSIEFLMTASEIVCTQGFIKLQVLRIRKTMPSPLALCAEGYTSRIILRKSLQTRGIDSDSKLTISHRQRCQCVHFSHYGAISIH